MSLRLKLGENVGKRSSGGGLLGGLLLMKCAGIKGGKNRVKKDYIAAKQERKRDKRMIRE